MYSPDHLARSQKTGLYQKKKTLRASEQDRPDIKAKRQDWQEKKLNPRRFVFLDESGAKTNMTRLRGWAKRGQRAYAAAPGGTWNTTTMISAIRHDGVIASMVLEGAMDGAAFEAYVEQVLAPALSPGDVVVMDNLSSHKSERIKELVEAVGAEVWYLPPYSPDLNPIEMMWSKVKEYLRSAAARTKETLYEAIRQALHTVTTLDIHNWFKSCGYLTYA